MEILKSTPLIIRALFISVAFFILQSNAKAQDLLPWTFSMRIAANTSKNADVIENTKDIEGSEVYTDGNIVFKWIPVAENRLDKFKIDKTVPKRINKSGGLEVLVLFSDKDITENNMITLSNVIGENESIDLIIVLDDIGSSLFFEQTKNNIDRYMVTIVDGLVYNIQKIVSAIHSQSIIIDGDFLFYGFPGGDFIS